MSAIIHSDASQCTVGSDDCCTVCGVLHGGPCSECEGVAFHFVGCSEIEHCCDDDCRSNGCSERFNDERGAL